MDLKKIKKFKKRQKNRNIVPNNTCKLCNLTFELKHDKNLKNQNIFLNKII